MKPSMLLHSLTLFLLLQASVFANEEPRVVTHRKGPVEVSLIAEPAEVHLDRKTLLTLRISAPEHIQTIVPPIQDRLTGFTLSGEFSSPDRIQDGKRVQEFNYRLSPTLAEEHRIAPMALSWVDSRQANVKSDWLATPALSFERARLLDDDADLSLAEVREAQWLMPSITSILVMAALVLIPLIALFFILRAIIRALRRRAARGLSPAQQALQELNALIAKALPESGQVREFYFELTMIVRRYIENAHKIRAPEQTTEEFLRTAAGSSIFSGETLDRLRAFMQASDLVKYAAQEPDDMAIEHALHTARHYIETDQDYHGDQITQAEPPREMDTQQTAMTSSPVDLSDMEETFQALLRDPMFKGRIQMLLQSDLYRRQQFIEDCIQEWRFMGMEQAVFDVLRQLASADHAHEIEQFLCGLAPDLSASREEQNV
jgi:hypothetical protein